VVETGGQSGESLGGSWGPGADAYRAHADATTAWQSGFQAGRAEAEGALRGAQESALQAGFKEGFERGVQEGRQQGLAEGREAGRQAVEREARSSQEAMAGRLAQLDQLLAALPAELGRRLASAEEDMVALCHAAVCRILGEQLVTPDGVVHCVAQAIREADGGSLLQTSDQRGLAVHVHPVDLESLQVDPRLASWLSGEASTRSAPVRWVADERVRLGGCLVRSSEGTLDARLETQLAALRSLLLDARPVSSGGSPSTDGQSVAGSLPTQTGRA
jgi:flagellar assembly protein FliH